MRLQTKVLALSLPLSVAFALLAAGSARRATESIMVRELGPRLTPQVEDYAARLAVPLARGQESRLLSPLQSAQDFSGAFFAECLDTQGRVIAHTNVLEKGKRRESEAVKRSLAATQTHVERDVLRGEPLLLISAPVWKHEEEFLLSGGARVRLGTLRLGLPLKPTLDSARWLGMVVGALAAGFCLLGLALFLSFVRVLLGPIVAVSEATARVAAGDYTVKVPVPSRDEVGLLAESFNSMSETLSQTVVSRDRLENALSLAKAAMDASADGILVIGPGLRAISMNDRFIRMWGLPQDLVASGDMRRTAEFVMPQLEDPAAFLSTTAKNSWDFEAPDARDILRLKDGRVFERITSQFLVAGRRDGRTVTIRDLTAHFEGVHKLNETLSIARAAMEASADGILVVGEGMRIITVNARFFEMWGVPKDVVVSGDIRRSIEYCKPLLEDPEGFVRMTEDARDFSAEERRDLIPLKDGRVFERISRPFLIAGIPRGRTISLHDMTLHHQVLAALSHARDEALAAARIKSSFLASVSHELRTPLNAVVGAAGLLSGTKLDKEQGEYAETLSRAAHALLEMIEGILDFSKIEAGRMSVEHMPLRVGSVLEDAAAVVSPQAAAKGLRLRLDAGEAAAWELMGDPTRLRQVLTNLLANAVKFTEKGAVRAEVRVLSQKDAAVALEISVHDTGIGITPDQGARLFMPFCQADATMSRRYGGTGLGLAICKSLVELMGGAIGFDSEPGRGARFWVRLELERAVPAAQRPSPAAAEPEGSGPRDHIRVLVVDDNETNRGLLVRQMERLGCPAEAASDGDAAIARLRADDFGLVLMDCQMPGRDGFETTREIRRLEAGHRRTPIVAVTGNTTADDRRSSLAAGMDDFLAKPATLEGLARIIDRWDLPFDETALAAFGAVAADSPQTLARLVDDFLCDARTRLEAARRESEGGDLKKCAAAAHAVKGACAAVGARGLRELARRIEACAKGEAPRENLASLLDQAQAQVARLAASRPKQ